MKPSSMFLLLLVLVSGLRADVQERLELPLAGSAKVKLAWMISVCEIRLYAGPGTAFDQLLEGGTPLSLEVEYQRSISADRLVQMGERALEDEYPVEVNQRFREQREKINAAYVDVKKDDIYRLDYRPMAGLTLSLNHEKVLRLEGDAFAQYYLSIWLGNNRVASAAKSQLEKSYFNSAP